MNFETIELVDWMGKQILVGTYPEAYAGFRVRAWFWNDDLDGWDEITNLSTVKQLLRFMGR